VQAWRAVCETDCAVERDGKPLYFDAGHPAKSNLAYAAPYIAAGLKAAGL
jgi:hypothetical protein